MIEINSNDIENKHRMRELYNKAHELVRQFDELISNNWKELYDRRNAKTDVELEMHLQGYGRHSWDEQEHDLDFVSMKLGKFGEEYQRVLIEEIVEKIYPPKQMKKMEHDFIDCKNEMAKLALFSALRTSEVNENRNNPEKRDQQIDSEVLSELIGMDLLDFSKVIKFVRERIVFIEDLMDTYKNLGVSCE